MKMLQELLELSAASHHNLCPRQVLGVRMGMLAGKVLNLDLPQVEKRLFTFVECDGCGMGGIVVATGCKPERRTMRVQDYGKLAATFVDTENGKAIRIHPVANCRHIAEQALPDAATPWHSQLEGYQILPDEFLFEVQPVELTVSLAAIISQPNLRVNCSSCGEEITNDRQVLRDGQAFCRSCAGDGYYIDPAQSSGPPALERRDIPVLTVIGRSGAGKTTLLEKVIQKLTDRGYRIAAIKHHSHSDFDFDVPGKDSWRFAQAGSRRVMIATPNKLASYRWVDDEIALDDLVADVTGVDLILVEGYKQANRPAIEVVRAANSSELIGNDERRIAIVSDLDWELGIPVFKLDDVDAIIAMIENRFLQRCT